MVTARACQSNHLARASTTVMMTSTRGRRFLSPISDASCRWRRGCSHEQEGGDFYLRFSALPVDGEEDVPVSSTLNEVCYAVSCPVQSPRQWRLRIAARKELKRVRKELKRRLRRFSDGDNLSPPVQSPHQPEPDGDDNINRRAEIFISDSWRFLSMEKRMFS
ncbi:hypothetical protein Q3G72_025899 [Acer saccharum]|nr:hypothetical protein Q3G72_025899 [Acer saccharum]